MNDRCCKWEGIGLFAVRAVPRFIGFRNHPDLLQCKGVKEDGVDIMKRYPEPYVEFLAHFHGTRDFFECHELLEEYWKRETDQVLLPIWHGLIQVAVSAYHERRGNRKGALKMIQRASGRLASSDVSLIGLDGEALQEMLGTRIGRLKSGETGPNGPYVDPELPVQDPELLHISRKLASDWGYDWGRQSPLHENNLIHRHMLRDRSDVVLERERRLQEKQGAGRGEAEG